MRRMIAALWVVGLLMLAGGTVARADDSQYFPQTGHTVSGTFLAYWRANGGLPVYGYPITDAQNETDPETGKVFLTQWFERNRFEFHPENAGTRYAVLLGLLGKDLRREALVADPDFAPVPNDPAFAAEGTWYFPQTGHTVRPRFRAYWEQNGGLERFGYPIAEEHLEVDPETGKTFSIQWFERARFEYHPENAAPYDILLGLLGNQIKKPKPGPTFVWKIGRDPYEIGYPQGVAVGSDGSVYVPDAGNFRVQKYTAGGRLLDAWGGKGSGPGQFGLLNPDSIAVSTSGSVAVNDISNHRVQLFDTHGEFKQGLTLPDAGTGFPNDPRAIAFDGQNSLYVFDSDHHILKLQGGAFSIWKSANNVSALAGDGAGNVFVANSDTTQIEKYAPNGALLTAWGGAGSDAGRFGEIDALATDGGGNVYALDNRTYRVQKFDNGGRLLAVWGVFGPNDGQLGASSGLAVDGAGRVYVADANAGRVQIFDNGGRFLGKWSSAGSDGDRFNRPTAVALDGQGHLFVADRGNHSIKRFDSTGRLQTAWGGYGSAPGQFSTPNGVAADAAGNVYVADTDNQRIQKFDANGTFLLQWGGYGTAPGQFDSPVGVAADAAGNVFVTDQYNRRVQVFDAAGHFRQMWGSFGGGPGLFATPYGIAATPQGRSYVADPGNPSVQTFDPSGHFLTKWIAPAIGVAVDAAGNVYTANDTLQKYDPNGQLLQTWSDKGSGNAEVAGAHGIAVDPAGNIYVADTLNHRIQKFRP